MHKKSWFDIYNIYIELELLKTSSRVHISSTQQAKAGQPPVARDVSNGGGTRERAYLHSCVLGWQDDEKNIMQNTKKTL